MIVGKRRVNSRGSIGSTRTNPEWLNHPNQMTKAKMEKQGKQNLTKRVGGRGRGKKKSWAKKNRKKNSKNEDKTKTAELPPEHVRTRNQTKSTSSIHKFTRNIYFIRSLLGCSTESIMSRSSGKHQLPTVVTVPLSILLLAFLHSSCLLLDNYTYIFIYFCLCAPWSWLKHGKPETANSKMNSITVNWSPLHCGTIGNLVLHSDLLPDGLRRALQVGWSSLGAPPKASNSFGHFSFLFCQRLSPQCLPTRRSSENSLAKMYSSNPGLPSTRQFTARSRATRKLRFLGCQK